MTTIPVQSPSDIMFALHARRGQNERIRKRIRDGETLSSSAVSQLFASPVLNHSGPLASLPTNYIEGIFLINSKSSDYRKLFAKALVRLN